MKSHSIDAGSPREMKLGKLLRSRRGVGPSLTTLATGNKVFLSARINRNTMKPHEHPREIARRQRQNKEHSK